MDPRHALGRATENFVENLYLGEAYEVIARNYRTRRGEIDLILKREDLIVFVEVKGRSRAQECFPILLNRQRRSLERAARVFLQCESERLDPWNELRFDLLYCAHGRVVERIEGESLYGA
jgi:putative endonuclease